MDNLALVLSVLYPKKKVVYHTLRFMQPNGMFISELDEKLQYVIFLDASVAKGRGSNKYFERTKTVGDIWVGEKNGVLFVTHKDNRDLSKSNYYASQNDVTNKITRDSVESMDIAQAILEMVEPDETKRENIVKEIANAARKEAIEKTVKDFSKNLDERLIQLEGSVINIQNNIASYRNTLVTESNKLAKTMVEISTFDIEKERDAVRQEIVNIISHKKVVNMEVISGYLHIYTVPLYLFEPKNKERFYLGKMVIKIKTTSCDIRFDNLDNRRRCYWSGGASPHPHVSSEGVPCLGNIDAQVADCFVKKQYYMLFLILLGYLETCNIDDCAGRRVDSWDKVDKEGKKLSDGSSEPEEGDEDWDDDDDDHVECDACGEPCNPDNMWSCEEDGCHAYICDDCVIQVDDGYYCPTHGQERRERG